jgi:import receptor subunit TOM70
MAPVPAATLQAPEPPTTLVERASRFIEDNKNLILIGAGVAAAAGAGYYLYSRNGRSGPSNGAKPSTGAGSGSSKNKKKKKSKKTGDKFLKGDGLDGPLLEEIKPKPTEKAAEPAAAVEDPFADVPDAAGLAAMSDADRNALGATLKDRGNKLYSKKDFKKAVECYTKAIEVSVKKDAVFYSNRAACEYAPSRERQEGATTDALRLHQLLAPRVRALC